MIYQLKNNLDNNGIKIKSFIQGLNIDSSNHKKIGLKQQNSYLYNKTIHLTYGSPLKSTIIHSLTISVIVFNINIPSVLYADGQIDQNFVISTTNITIPRHGIN
jgi:hypothetical protein